MLFRKSRKSKENFSSTREWIESIAVAVYFVLIVRLVLIQSFRIPTPSMVNTLLVGDFLFVERLSLGPRIAYHRGNEELWNLHLFKFADPKRGDIIAFRYPIDGRDFVKRCIGLPGDTVRIIDKKVYINGKSLEEDYTVFSDDRIFPSLFQTQLGASLTIEEYQKLWEERKFHEGAIFPYIRDNFGPIVVPRGQYLMLGDNRDNSDDSRAWGPVPAKELRGKPLILYFSFNMKENEKVIAPWKWVKWTRIGRLLI
ncbi:signal peptidase I [candidate division WOR-3 bacterium]|nr:signal peptidase I [candidate division WOR-3 bacterium]